MLAVLQQPRRPNLCTPRATTMTALWNPPRRETEQDAGRPAAVLLSTHHCMNLLFALLLLWPTSCLWGVNKPACTSWTALATENILPARLSQQSPPLSWVAGMSMPPSDVEQGRAHWTTGVHERAPARLRKRAPLPVIEMNASHLGAAPVYDALPPERPMQSTERQALPLHLHDKKVAEIQEKALKVLDKTEDVKKSKLEAKKAMEKSESIRKDKPADKSEKSKKAMELTMANVGVLWSKSKELYHRGAAHLAKLSLKSSLTGEKML